MRRIVVAVVVVAAGEARGERECGGACGTAPATVEWTYWIGVGTGDHPIGVRAGAAVDFELLQVPNPWRYGGAFEVRMGPWLAGETVFERHHVEGGVLLDVGQVKHASFGTYTLRLGGGVDDDRRPTASLTLLGGVRWVPRRFSGCGCIEGPPRGRRFAFASGGRVFATARTDFEGETEYLIGIEFEPTWVLPPYSVGKVAGNPRW